VNFNLLNNPIYLGEYFFFTRAPFRVTEGGGRAFLKISMVGHSGEQAVSFFDSLDKIVPGFIW